MQNDESTDANIENNENSANNVDTESADSLSGDSIKDEQEESSNNKEEEDSSFFKSNRGAILSITAISVVIFSFVVWFMYDITNPPSVHDDGATSFEESSDLSDIPAPELLNGEISKTENGTGFLSTIEGIENTESAFVFGQPDMEIDENTNVVDVYISFTGQKSVDLLLNSLAGFKSSVYHGQFVLVVHPVATTFAASELIPEAIAQVSDKDSSKTWGMLEQSLATSSLRNRGDYDDDMLVKLLVKSAKNLGVNDIEEDDIYAAHFNQWLLENQEHVAESVKTYVPSIYVNGERISEDDANILDSNELFAEISARLADSES